MAKKRTGPSLDGRRKELASELRAGRYAEAWQLARQLWNDEPGEETLSTARAVVKEACEHFADAGSPGDFAKYFAFAESLPKGDGNEWAIALGMLQARAGDLSKARSVLEPLGDPVAMTRAVGYVADKTILSRQPALLPADFHPAYDAILASFDHYHAGRDDKARESLAAIGLQSPYLEWKVLLRGLIAHAAADDARAIENFARLAPDRAPARIAAVFRVKIDPAFRGRLTPDAVADGERKYQQLSSGVILRSLQAIRENLGRRQSLAAAFSELESALRTLKAQKPELLPKLANCFYQTILHHGHPDDLKRFRKAFGPPAEDPHFHKLQGQILEQTDQREESLASWQGYVEWLEHPPADWPAVLAKRMKARVLYRMGNIATDLAEETADDDFDFFESLPAMLRPKAKPKSKAVRKRPDANQFFVGAVEAAPDWEVPALEVFDRYVAAGDLKTAEMAARAHLHHRPDSLAMLERLAVMYGRQGRAAECLDCRRKVLEANPLDQDARGQVLKATVAVARRLAAEKKYDAASGTLDAVPELNGGNPHYTERALRGAISRKRGGAKSELRGLPQAVLIDQYLAQVHATVLKFKPADKKAVVAEFAAALAAPQPPIAWAALYLAMADVDAEGLAFTGEQALRKKVLAAIAGSAAPGATEDYEGLAVLLEEYEEWPTLQKLAASLAKLYPRHPLFPFQEVLATISQPGKKSSPGILSRKLYKVEDLLGNDPKNKFASLLPRVREMLHELNPMQSIFESFFSPR